MQQLAAAFKENREAIEGNQKLISVLERRRDFLFRELERLQEGADSKNSGPVTIDLTGKEVDDDDQ